MNLFLAPDTTSTFVTLSPDDSRHCIRVLRMQAGDSLAITSGDGTLCHARIINPDPRGCEVEITQRIENYSPRPFHLHLAVAPTKNTARIEWLLEKAVEIGIDRRSKPPSPPSTPQPPSPNSTASFSPVANALCATARATNATPCPNSTIPTTTHWYS